MHLPTLPMKPGNVGTSVQLAPLVSCQLGIHGHCLMGVVHGGTHGVGFRMHSPYAPVESWHQMPNRG